MLKRRRGEQGRFGVLDLARNFSGWMSVRIELPSRAEAERAAAAQLEERRYRNVQLGRPDACSLGPAGATSTEGHGGSLALCLGLVAAGVRRARRARR